MTETNTIHSITKQLSANDTGETGGHQAGILVPKDPVILNYFPVLTKETLNPRRIISCTDEDGYKWEFHFIYYNNRFFKGTRNEFRLTRMMPYFKKMGLKSGDEIILEKDQTGKHFIHSKKINSLVKNGVIKLGSSWKVISIKRKQ